MFSPALTRCHCSGEIMQLLSDTACRDNNSLSGVLFVRIQFSLYFDVFLLNTSVSQILTARLPSGTYYLEI